MRKNLFFLFFFACLSILSFAPAYGQSKCVDAEGEAAIVNNDRPAAKMEAIARAKW